MRASTDTRATGDAIRMGVVGNHELVTDGLDALLDQQAGMTVVSGMSLVQFSFDVPS